MADLTKEALRRLLAHLANVYTLVGPVENGKIVEYKPTSAAAVLLDDRLPYSSPKEFLFPQDEKIFTLTEAGAEPCTPAERLLLFGAKPCDLAGMAVLKAVLLGGRNEDPLFAARLQNSLIIGVSCAEQKPGCFCDALGLSRAHCENCDLFFAAGETGCTLTHANEKGQKTLQSFDETKNLTPSSVQKTNGENTLSLANAPDENALFSAISWEQAAETCLGCALCTYLCPTCHCFAFRDAATAEGTARYRCWDSCMQPKFTLHASGHNPRAKKHERYRQRLLHKYYYIEQNTGLAACTGCGRCVRSCPAGIDIGRIAAGVREALK